MYITQISINSFILTYFAGNFKVVFTKILMKRNPRPIDESHILKIPKIETIITLKWLCLGNQNNHYFNLSKPLKIPQMQNFSDFSAEKLDIELFLNMPKEDEFSLNFTDKSPMNFTDKNLRNSDFLQESTIFRKIVKYSDVFFFYYNSQFIEWIMNLPQLRHDMLKLYRINPQDYAEDEENSEETIDVENMEKGFVKYSDYLELLQYALNIQLNQVDKDMNFFKLIDKINLKLFVSGARFFNELFY